MTTDRIAHVEPIPLAFPLAQPFRAAVRTIASVDVLLLRLHTREGRCGHGWAFAFGPQDLVPIVASVQALIPSLIDADPLAVERHSAEMMRSLALLGASGASLATLSALDIALWDLCGQAAGLPLYRLLGAARDSTPVYGSGGSLALATDALVAEAAGFAAQGYGAYKMKAGHGPRADLERVRAVREAVGERLRLIVDGNQQWTPKAAIETARRLAPLDLWWLEEPVAAADVEGCAEVRRAASMEVATGETNFGLGEVARLLGARAADIVMPNLQRIGGITGWRKAAALAEVAGVPIASHVYPEVGVHLMCAAPNALVLEVVPWWPRLFVEPLAITDGQARPPERPGLGLTLDEDVLARHRLDAKHDHGHAH